MKVLHDKVLQHRYNGCAWNVRMNHNGALMICVIACAPCGLESYSCRFFFWGGGGVVAMSLTAIWMVLMMNRF